MAGAVAAFGGRVGFGHVLQHGVTGGETAHEQRALVADHGREPVVFIERIGGGAGAGFLAKAEINSADDLALLVEVLERALHFAVEQHEAVDLDALILVEILRVADRWDGRLEICAVFVFFYSLADGEIGMLEAQVGDGVGAEAAVCCRFRRRGRNAISSAMPIRTGPAIRSLLLDRHRIYVSIDGIASDESWATLASPFNLVAQANRPVGILSRGKQPKRDIAVPRCDQRNAFADEDGNDVNIEFVDLPGIKE